MAAITSRAAEQQHGAGAARGAAVASAPRAPAAVSGAASGPATHGSDGVAAWVGEYVRRRAAEAEGAGASPAAGAVPLSELKARIAHHHAHLVESIARRYLGSGEPLDDLIQEGYLGLLSALDHYDPERGAQASGGRSAKFSTYATHFIAGSIRHFLRDRGKVIKEPAWLHELSGKVARTTDRLTATLGRAPDAAEIAQALNLTEEAVEEIQQTRRTFQVAAFGASSDDDSGLAVGLVDPEKIRSDRYETLRLPIEDRIVLEGAMTRLKALEQKVLFEFFYQDSSQTEIARKMDISCNYVSHILKNSTQKLRRVLGEADVRERGRAGGRGEAAASVVHPASGLFTPEHVRARIEEELGRAARAGHPAALLLVRIGGMPAGGLRREEAWRAVGAAVRKTVRRIDVAGHAAAAATAVAAPEEDLLLLLPSTTAEQAEAVAQRLGDVLLAAGAATGEQLVVSVGVALYPAHGRSLRSLLAAASITIEKRAVVSPLATGGEAGVPDRRSLKRLAASPLPAAAAAAATAASPSP